MQEIIVNGMDSISMICIPVSGKGFVGRPSNDSNKDLIKIVFSFDTTGLMYNCLENVRDCVNTIPTRLFKDVPNVRIGVAHDYCDENQYYVMQWIDFTTDLGRLTPFVAAGQSGGDSRMCFILFYIYILYFVFCIIFTWKRKIRQNKTRMPL